VSDEGTLTSYCSKQYRSQAERLFQACKKRTKSNHTDSQWGDDNRILMQEEKQTVASPLEGRTISPG